MGGTWSRRRCWGSVTVLGGVGVVARTDGRKVVEEEVLGFVVDVGMVARADGQDAIGAKVREFLAPWMVKAWWWGWVRAGRDGERPSWDFFQQ